jgi:ComF family protein
VFDRSLIRRWSAECLGALADLAFPLDCVICGQDGTRTPFCDDCRAELREARGEACPRCALGLGPWARSDGGCSVCRERTLGFDAAVALGPYQGPIREVCLRLKHQRDAWLAPWVADVLAEARGEQLRAEGPDGVVAVPLHWSRRLRRGYNQAEALAAGLARRLGAQLRPALRRIVATEPLAGLGRTERDRLMKQAFRARNRVRLQGQTIILVDDILTTGATCGAAARALKKVGAQRVIVAVIGRAEGNF